ncbi:hypothetical protein HCU74_08075 [Spongiibacter sp. KMU-166]|uniref:Scaffold protein FimL second domain-containing protein n=1 Tax=Spongiibacter thalassae TaxID=2721624 RepID=A0ABX1GEM4_9GAMM|nr:hypothetical protein [Spongiibacter thalassae]NKI17371.1 hypothetical protein [Spongiibacter thalassae]
MPMQDQIKREINSSSYALVSAELSNTLQQATNIFETYLAERHDLSLLEQCESDLRQIGGTLRLIEVPGAALLADEMRALCKSIISSTVAVPEGQLNALSTAFFVIPRYLEFVNGNGYEIPLMAISHANELRAAHKQLLLPDSYFNDPGPYLFSRDSQLKLRSANVSGSAFAELLTRVRKLYQSGLLGLLREAQPGLQLTLLSRALQRLCSGLEAGPRQRFWLLASAVVDALLHEGLELNMQRKRLLASLEGQLRNLGSGKPHDEVLEQELMFLLRLSAWQEGFAGKLIRAAKVKTFAVNEGEVRKLRQQMLGLSYDTVSSVLSELRMELRHAKDILELVAQHGRSEDEELRPLGELLQQSADVLLVLNLPALAEVLGEHAKTLLGFIGKDLSQHRDGLEELAETLLFIESSLAQIDRRKLNYEELNDLSMDKRDAISADNQVNEAVSIVIEEAKNTISMVKRAIAAYIDSGFDQTHIANVPPSLNAVRGAFQILKMQRLTAVCQSSAEFVGRYIAHSQSDAGKDGHSLETLADAMISIEYYLGELERRHLPDAKILQVAEDALSQLGFPVSTEPRSHAGA